jgi:hypothetical protein
MDNRRPNGTRDRRRQRPKSITIRNEDKLSRAEKREMLRLGSWRPKLPANRGECMTGPRPCPHVSCKHHMHSDVDPDTGSLKVNFPELAPWAIAHSCALDLSDMGGLTLEETGHAMNLTLERVRQIEVLALRKMRRRMTPEMIAELLAHCNELARSRGEWVP